MNDHTEIKSHIIKREHSYLSETMWMDVTSKHLSFLINFPRK